MNEIKMYMNRETGDLLTREQMRQQGAELYDLDDDTNGLEWAEYYDVVIIRFEPEDSPEKKIIKVYKKFTKNLLTL